MQRESKIQRSRRKTVKARFDAYKSRGQWRWRVVASNGRIIAVASEGYASKRGAMRGAEITMVALRRALSE